MKNIFSLSIFALIIALSGCCGKKCCRTNINDNQTTENLIVIQEDEATPSKELK